RCPRAHPAWRGVVDPHGDRLPDTIDTLLIAERQVWLPTRYSIELVHTDIDNPEIMSRLDLWREWQRGRFRDETAAATMAGRADVLIGPPDLQSASWERRYAGGAYAVYQSRSRSGR